MSNLNKEVYANGFEEYKQEFLGLLAADDIYEDEFDFGYIEGDVYELYESGHAPVTAVCDMLVEIMGMYQPEHE